MALQKQTQSVHGFDAPQAYHRVEGVSVSKSEIEFRLRSYKDASSDTSFADEGFVCSYDIAGDNPIKQAYEHLKTLPEFADAADA